MVGSFDPNGMKYASALDLITRHEREMPFEVLAAQYAGVLAECIADCQYLVLEMRRRVLERTLMSASGKQMPVAVCLKLRRRLNRIGHTDGMQKCLTEIIVCRYLIQCRAIRPARRILRSLQREIAEGMRLPRGEKGRTQKIVAELLQKCEGSANPARERNHPKNG